MVKNKTLKNDSAAQALLQKILSHSPVTTKRFAALAVGEKARQGDIYIIRVPNNWPKGGPWGSRQVAVGNSIGSRHIAVGNVEVFAGQQSAFAELVDKWEDERQIAACCGPVVVVRREKGEIAWTLEHPEHPHHEVRPIEADAECATFQIGYQWNAHTKARVQD